MDIEHVIAAIMVCTLLVVIVLALSRASKTRLTPEERMTINGPGNYAIDVVGESFHQKELEQLDGEGAFGEDRECQAELLLDDKNKYDKNAVAVYIAGVLVGHLSRQIAPVFRRELQKHGAVRAFVRAKVFGGTKKKPNFGIWLDL